jgi:hypothetical protein
MSAETSETYFTFYATYSWKSYINGVKFHQAQFYWASQIAVTCKGNYAERVHASLQLSEYFKCNMLLTNDTRKRNIFPSPLPFYILAAAVYRRTRAVQDIVI